MKTVGQLIEELQKYPQDLEIYSSYDVAGNYRPKEVDLVPSVYMNMTGGESVGVKMITLEKMVGILKENSKNQKECLGIF